MKLFLVFLMTIIGIGSIIKILYQSIKSKSEEEEDDETFNEVLKRAKKYQISIVEYPGPKTQYYMVLHLFFDDKKMQEKHGRKFFNPYGVYRSGHPDKVRSYLRRNAGETQNIWDDEKTTFYSEDEVFVLELQLENERKLIEYSMGKHNFVRKEEGDGSAYLNIKQKKSEEDELYELGQWLIKEKVPIELPKE